MVTLCYDVVTCLMIKIIHKEIVNDIVDDIVDDDEGDNCVNEEGRKT